MKYKYWIFILLALGITTIFDGPALAESSLTKFLQKKYSQCIETKENFSTITTRNFCACTQSELRNNIDILDLKMVQNTPSDPRFYNKIQLSLSSCYHHLIAEKIMNSCEKSIKEHATHALRKQCRCIASKTAEDLEYELPSIYARKIKSTPYQVVPLTLDNALEISNEGLVVAYNSCLPN